MSREDLADTIAFATANAARSLGVETGISLGLVLVYTRYSALASADAARTADWHELRRHAARSAPVEQALERVFDSTHWARPSPLGWQRLEEDGGRALWSMVDLLDRLPEPLGTARDKQVARELHREVFESLLDAQVERAGRASGEYRTPPWMALLTVGVCGPRLGRTLDPACGFGETLLRAGQVDPSAGLSGWDISAEAAGTCRMRLELWGVDAEIRQVDALSPAGDEHFDTVLLQPPWGMALKKIEVPMLRYGSPTRNLDLVWAQRAIDLLSNTGTAVTHLPEGALVRSGAEAAIRAAMLQDGVIEAVIALPEGMAFGTRVKSALFLLRPPMSPRSRHDAVLMIDGSDLGVLASRSEVQLAPTDVDEIAGCVQEWRALPADERVGFERPGLARGVRAETLATNGAQLLPSEHVTRAPKRPASFPEPAGRLFQELRVQNFKSFGRSQTVRLAPITLLYGPNAAGKSAVIQSLVLLRQSLAAGRLVTQGLANLGSFEGLIHRHDRDLPLEIGVSFSAPLKSADPAGMANPAAVRSADLRFVADAGGRAHQSDIVVSLDGVSVPFTVAERRSETGASDFVASTKELGELLAALHDGLLYRAAETQRRPLAPEEQERDARRRARRLSETQTLLAKHLAEGVRFSPAGLFPGDADIDVEDYVSTVGQGAARVAVIRNQLRDAGVAIASVARELRTILDDMAWLGPLRSAPERFYARSEADEAMGLGARGEHVAMHLYDNESEVVVVNEWFDKLDIPYELRVVPVFAGDRTPTVGDLVAIVLRDKRLAVDTSPADVGFGISQVLPIVVQLLASQQGVVAIEQPEIHLHPRLQAELADLVIATTSAAEQANQVIVETHSEHLMLRLQRRIREGTLSADDVSVMYIDLHEGDREARARQLRLDASGYFLDEWPQGFFDERLDELFGGDE